jgi:hypothetical protein
MNIELKVSAKQSDINPAQIQKLRRITNVLSEDFSVSLSFLDGGLNEQEERLVKLSKHGFMEQKEFIQATEITKSTSLTEENKPF